MTTILIVDADPGVRTLVRLVAQDALPDARFVEVHDAPEFAMALAEPDLTAAIVSREVGWADGHALLLLQITAGGQAGQAVDPILRERGQAAIPRSLVNAQRAKQR